MSEFLEIAATSIPGAFRNYVPPAGEDSLSAFYNALEKKRFSFGQLTLEIVGMPKHVAVRLDCAEGFDNPFVYFKVADEILLELQRELSRAGRCDWFESALMKVLDLDEVRVVVLEGGGEDAFPEILGTSWNQEGIREHLLSAYLGSANVILEKKAR